MRRYVRRPRTRPVRKLATLIATWSRYGFTASQAQAAEYARVMGADALRRQWIAAGWWRNARYVPGLRRSFTRPVEVIVAAVEQETPKPEPRQGLSRFERREVA